MKGKQLKQRTHKAIKKKEREVIAQELPLRQHAATMAGIAARNEILNALTASMLKSDLQRVETLLHNMPQPRNAAVINAAKQLKADLSQLARA